MSFILRVTLISSRPPAHHPRSSVAMAAAAAKEAMAGRPRAFQASPGPTPAATSTCAALVRMDVCPVGGCCVPEVQDTTRNGCACAPPGSRAQIPESRSLPRPVRRRRSRRFLGHFEACACPHLGPDHPHSKFHGPFLGGHCHPVLTTPAHPAPGEKSDASRPQMNG